MRFAGPTIRLARQVAPRRSRAFDEWADDACVQLYRMHPELEGPDAAAVIARLLDGSGFGPLVH